MSLARGASGPIGSGQSARRDRGSGAGSVQGVSGAVGRSSTCRLPLTHEPPSQPLSEPRPGGVAAVRAGPPVCAWRSYLGRGRAVSPARQQHPLARRGSLRDGGTARIHHCSVAVDLRLGGASQQRHGPLDPVQGSYLYVGQNFGYDERPCQILMPPRGKVLYRFRTTALPVPTNGRLRSSLWRRSWASWTATGPTTCSANS